MTVYFGRRYCFSALHRLFCPGWDAQRNQETFGKCANPYGHGHNYVVEVLVAGSPDPVTGMAADLHGMDQAVRQRILDPFDHSNLNLLAAFAGCVPTSENLCIEIFDRLLAVLPGLRQVRVEETTNNSFTYTGGQPAPGPVGTR